MRVFFLVLLVLSPVALPAQTALDRPRPRPEVERCTPDRSACIRLASYTEDVCTLIEAASEEHDLDTGFFARLLWRESLYDAAAISPVGAQGIAQFMPGTAELRGLADPFNPADAILASADYLAELTDMFGNEGLAAAAYNSGEKRTTDFVESGRRLPPETRAYVRAITGHSGTDWRDDPPRDVDYALSPDETFQDACRRQAATRSVKSFAPQIPPYGVIVASGRRRATVEGFADRIRRDASAALGGRSITIAMQAIPGFGTKPRHVARVSAQTAAEARELCTRLRQSRVFCKIVEP